MLLNVRIVLPMQRWFPLNLKTLVAPLQVDRATLEQELATALSTADAEASNPWHWVGVGQYRCRWVSWSQPRPVSCWDTNWRTRTIARVLSRLVEMKRKNFRAAEDWFTFTLAQDKQCWEAWMNRAATRVELSQFAGAIEDIQAMGVSKRPLSRRLVHTRTR